MEAVEYGFGDWLESIKTQVGDALEKAQQKAKEILEGIEIVGGDAWEKIKDAAKGLEVTRKGEGYNSVVEYPLTTLWVAGSSLVMVRSLNGGRLIDLCNETRDWVTGCSDGGQKFK